MERFCENECSRPHGLIKEECRMKRVFSVRLILVLTIIAFAQATPVRAETAPKNWVVMCCPV
jgi:hypothetical protein